MFYNFLSPSLHEYADKILPFLKERYGISNVEVETQIEKRIDISPTLSGRTKFGFLVFVEVSEATYPRTIDPMVADAVKKDIPVKIFVANPEKKDGKVDQTQLRRLSKQGIGFLTVGDEVEEIKPALEQSLYLPDFKDHNIPRKFVPNLKNAVATYQNGDPVKGFSSLADDIEELIRNCFGKYLKNGLFTGTYSFDYKKHPLAIIIQTLRKESKLNTNLLGRCDAFKDMRNDSSHPPKNYKKRLLRHQQLKTYFNFSVTLLRDLYKYYYSSI